MKVAVAVEELVIGAQVLGLCQLLEEMPEELVRSHTPCLSSGKDE
jgi:hypothetical protein